MSLADTPAFPCAGYDGPDHSQQGIPGMTYRQWLAGKILAGAGYFNTVANADERANFARTALAYTDALIAELEKPT